MSSVSNLKDSYGNPINTDAFIVRATELTDFTQCRRRWFFQSHNGLNLQSKRKSMKLIFGTAWHAALEKYYTTKDFNRAFLAFSTTMNDEVREVFNASSPEYHIDIQNEFDELNSLGSAMLDGYVRWATTEATPKDSELDFFSTELRLVVPFMDNCYLATKLDAVASGVNGNTWVFEHKTVGKSLSVETSPMLQLDLQMGLQLLALTYLKGTPFMDGKAITGSIYNLARKQAPSARVRSPLFARHLVFRDKRALEQIAKSLNMITTEMRLAHDNPRKLYHNPHPYGGICSWGCQFKDVCEAMCNGDDYEYLLKTNYKQREKDIFETLEDEME